MDDEIDTGRVEQASAALQLEVVAVRQAIAEQTAPDCALTLGAIVKELQGATPGRRRQRGRASRRAERRWRTSPTRNGGNSMTAASSDQLVAERH